MLCQGSFCILWGIPTQWMILNSWVHCHRLSEMRELPYILKSWHRVGFCMAGSWWGESTSSNWPERPSFNHSFVADPCKLLNKQTSCQIFETPGHSYDTNVITEVSNFLKPASMYQWFSARQYFQCVRNGNTAVLNKAMGSINTNNKVWNYSKMDKINRGCTHH